MIISSIQKTDTFSNATTFTNPIPLLIKKTIPQETMLFHIGFAKMGPPNGGDCQFISINSIPLYCTICTIIFRCA